MVVLIFLQEAKLCLVKKVMSVKSQMEMENACYFAMMRWYLNSTNKQALYPSTSVTHNRVTNVVTRLANKMNIRMKIKLIRKNKNKNCLGNLVIFQHMTTTILLFPTVQSFPVRNYSLAVILFKVIRKNIPLFKTFPFSNWHDLTCKELFFSGNLLLASTVVLTVLKGGKVVVVATTATVHKGLALSIHIVKEPALFIVDAVTGGAWQVANILTKL